MSSTGATADGFDRQFGIGRAGDAPCQLIGNVEALCQSIDPGRVFIGKIPSAPRVATAVRRVGSVPAPARCPPGISPRQPWACYESAPETVRFKYRAFLSYSLGTSATGIPAPISISNPTSIPSSGFPSLLQLLCCSVSLRLLPATKPVGRWLYCEHWRLPGGAIRTRRRALRRCRRIDEAR